MKRTTALATAAAAALAILTPPTATAVPFEPVTGEEETMADPLVIAHRGASGYRPEHTLAAYELAARMGADFIEPDLVSTSDGVLVARHENLINDTTDVAEHPEFADRKRTKMVDGKELTGWFTEDFTLAELKTLRAKERLPKVRPANTLYDGKFEIPTFDEILELRAQLSDELGRQIGVYPETKHPTYFTNRGLPMEEALVASLEKHDLNREDAPVFVQSFELLNLTHAVRWDGLKARTVFLIWKDGAPYDLTHMSSKYTYEYFTTERGLELLYRMGIDGVGPEMTLVRPWNDDGTLGEATNLVADAHSKGMLVHTYTFRAENTFQPESFRCGSKPNCHGRTEDLIAAYLDTGIDGFFTDHTDIGVKATNNWVAKHATATN